MLSSAFRQHLPVIITAVVVGALLLVLHRRLAALTSTVDAQTTRLNALLTRAQEHLDAAATSPAASEDEATDDEDSESGGAPIVAQTPPVSTPPKRV